MSYAITSRHPTFAEVETMGAAMSLAAVLVMSGGLLCMSAAGVVLGLSRLLLR